MRFCFFYVLSNQSHFKLPHCWNESKPIQLRIAPSPACQQSWTASFENREVWFPIAAFDLTWFSTCQWEPGQLFFACCKNTLFDSIPAHVVVSRSINFGLTPFQTISFNFSLIGKNPENFVHVPHRHLFALHPATSAFMSSPHKRTQHLCHPIPS